MKYVMKALLAALLLAASVRGDGDDETKKDLEKVQGSWKAVAWTIDKDVRNLDAGTLWMEIEKEGVILYAGLEDLKREEATFKIDPSKTPRTFDLTWADKQERFGIYKIDENELTICYTSLRDSRPKDFDTKPRDGLVSVTFKRPTKAESAKLAAAKEEEARKREEAIRKLEEEDKRWARKQEQEAKRLASKREEEAKRLAPMLEARRKAAKDNKDPESLQGVWRIVRSEQGALDDTWEVEDHRISFEKDAFVLRKGDKVLLEGKFKVDTSQNPNTIDITIREGQDKGKSILGIWEITVDGLRWCVGEPGKDRPWEFSTNKGGTDRLARFEKVSKPR
jgi:uncharacterized protein (TIGR03067 family)